MAVAARSLSVRGNLLLSFAFACIPARLSYAQAGTPDRPFQQRTVHSEILGEERRILVRLPDRYDSDTSARYAVIYKLDGDNQLTNYDESIRALAREGAMPDLIVVAIPNARGQRNRDLTPPSLHQIDGVDGAMGTGEMGRGDRFLEFIVRELAPQIEKDFRTAPERILAGHSRGALIALQSLLSQAGFFQGRFVFSAPLMRDEERLLVETRQFLKSHPELKSYIYWNWGEAENEGMNKSCAAMKAMLTEYAPKGLRWTIERAPGADHQTTQPLALPSALRGYFATASRGGH